jgi:hypothetical protein
MAQPTTAVVNGVSDPDHVDDGALTVSGKRKRDASESDDQVNGDADVKPALANGQLARDEGALVKSFFALLKTYVSFALDSSA